MVCLQHEPPAKNNPVEPGDIDDESESIFLNLTVVCCSGSETARCEGYRFNGTVWQLVGDARAGSVL